MLGIELELVSVRSLSDLRAKLREAVEADAVWFINDPVVGKREALSSPRRKIRTQNRLSHRSLTSR